ncbi:helix-turn-helix transcriptional regulator [Rhodococcus oryzae]|uniref:helix-turn-helix transcriptional regulator n=1 Tax=Rhodococcus oryzae TaxID=2571143 RepID=UPI0037235918
MTKRDTHRRKGTTMTIEIPIGTATTTTVVLDPYITSTQCQELLGVSRTTIARWRDEGYGPKALAVGRRYRYKTADVIAFLEGREPTAS